MPLLEINCAAIPENLVEAELFGYERGAFTDARQSKPGLFQAARRILFLDEMGTLPLAEQAASRVTTGFPRGGSRERQRTRCSPTRGPATCAS